MPTLHFLPRSRRPRYFFPLALCLCPIAPCTWARTVWVITDHEHPVHTIPSARVVELDAPGRLLATLSAQLPRDPLQASAIVWERLQTGGLALQKRLAAAYQGVLDAWSLGVTRIPAVVVDGQYVVYGVPDVDQALRLIDRYRRKPQ